MLDAAAEFYHWMYGILNITVTEYGYISLWWYYKRVNPHHDQRGRSGEYELCLYE